MAREDFNREFRDSHRIRAAGASRVLGLLRRWLPFNSVLDVGCGHGAWIEAARGSGSEDGFGIDGPWIDPALVQLPPGMFEHRDLSAPFDLGRRFDLVISLEVAEHLPPERGPGFVDDLIRHGDGVLFSAAVPYQTGNGHVNERPQHYWAELFRDRGLIAVDVLRPRLWGDEAVFWWLRQNMILYLGQDRLAAVPELAPFAVRENLERLSIIHPDLLTIWVEYAVKAANRG